VHRIGRTGRAGAKGDAISLHTDKDERLLVDIEKLIKQKIVRLQLAGFVATSLHAVERKASSFAQDRSSKNSERPVRAERSERSERVERSPRPSSREKIDPWFLKPYEPSASPALKPAETSMHLNAANPTNNSEAKPQKRAALLGGLKIN
jgi:superfamily II DNA/RNA helicase